MIFLNFRIAIALIFNALLLSVYVGAAGGGGGGGGSSGLGFSNARDSVFILVYQDHSAKFSLKNGTRYDLKITVAENNVNVTFGSVKAELKGGDNFVDLNSNNLADINFNLVSASGRRANIRLIDARELVTLTGKDKTAVVQESQEDEDTEKEEENEDEIKCGNLPFIRDRVSCRLDLDKQEQKEELEIYFMPEECRLLPFSEQKTCIDRYHSVQKCWQFPIGSKRVSCVKDAMDLGIIKDEKQLCSALDKNRKESCINNLRNKVYNLIKWRFYDLEERAEDFMLRGLANRRDVADFIVKTEQNKVQFNQAKTKEERKNIILDVRNDWKEFVKIVRENLRGQYYVIQ